MAPNSLDFNCALVTGGAGGIGKAIAQYFLSQGKKVIICGRTESKLQGTSQELGGIPYYVLDTGVTTSIPAFIQTLLSEHPEVDCLVNNAGVQRPLSYIDMPAEEFLEKADNEININIKGPLHLAVGLLAHFRKQRSAVIMNVSSVLGFVPFAVINPIYNGTKAALHFHTMNLRTQLAKAGANIKVVEIVSFRLFVFFLFFSSIGILWMHSGACYSARPLDAFSAPGWMARLRPLALFGPRRIGRAGTSVESSSSLFSHTANFCKAPPGVESDLHREREDPDDNKKHKNPIALSMEEFMEEVIAGWKANKDCIGAGISQPIVDRWDNEFGTDYDRRVQ